MATTKGGKKNRKYGRGTRSPSAKSYVTQGRREINKAKRAVRHAKRMAKKTRNRG